MVEKRQNQSLQLSDKIDTYIGGDPDRGFPGGFDGTNLEGGPLEREKINALSTALHTYNTTNHVEAKEALFQFLYELMQTTPKFFAYVLKDNVGVQENLNIRLMRIFCVESKWHTTHPDSSEYDETRDHNIELMRLRYCSIKIPIPSVLFLEFLLFVCSKIDVLIQELCGEVRPSIIDDTPRFELVRTDLAKEHHDSNLFKINLIGRISRVSDNESVLNMGFHLHQLQIVTPEPSEQVKVIKERILDIYKRRTRFDGNVTPSKLSFSSTLGILCEDTCKGFIPEDATGGTQSQSQSPERSSEIKLRDTVTVGVLDSSKSNTNGKALSEQEITTIAESFGWCPFLFTSIGCFRHPKSNESPDDKRIHYNLYRHPVNYIPKTKCTFDVCNEVVNFRAKPPYGGRKSLKKYRKNNKRSFRPNICCTRRPSTKHRRTKRRTKRHTTRRRTKHRRH
jgi:hypothetical protein